MGSLAVRLALYGQIVNRCPFSRDRHDVQTHRRKSAQDISCVVCMEVDRRDEFSGVKNAEGEDSPASAKAEMIEVYARWLEAAGVHVPRDTDGSIKCCIEISPLFALDAVELAAKVPADLQLGSTLYLE